MHALMMKNESIGLPKEGIYMVTPEMARVWLAKYNYQHQRKIRPYHVSSLARMMEQGRFRTKTQVNFMRLGERFFITNGQHTFSAIEQSGTPQLLSVIVSEASSEEEIADDYSRHDTHLTRQHGDSLIAHEMDQFFGVTPTQLNKMAAASIYFAKIVGRIAAGSATQITHDEKLDLLREYGPLALRAVRLIEENTTETVRWAYRKTTMGAMMFCLDKQPEIAEQFWSFVISDDGLTVGDPRKTLRRYLSDVGTTGGASTKQNARYAAAHEFVKASAQCWNAFIEHRDLRRIRVDFKATTATFKRCGKVAP